MLNKVNRPVGQPKFETSSARSSTRSQSSTRALAQIVDSFKRAPIQTTLKTLVYALAVQSVSARPVADRGGSLTSLVPLIPPGPTHATPVPTMPSEGAVTNRTLAERSEQRVFGPIQAEPVFAIVDSPHGKMTIFPRPGQTLAERIEEFAQNDMGDPAAVLANARKTNGPKEDKQLAEAVQLLRRGGRVARIDEMTPEALRALSVVLHRLGQQVLERHVAWHNFGGEVRSGGMEGWGSGDIFLGFHRQIVAAAEQMISDGWRMPEWDPMTPVPPQLTAQTGTPFTRDPKVWLRGFLTLEGRGGEFWDGTHDLDGRQFKNLNDFKSPDELGRGMGMSGYHASAHGALGGVMNSFESPLDDAFCLWHGHIDHIFDKWLESDSGRAWTKSNPDDPLLNRQTPYEVYDSVSSIAAERRKRGVGIELSDNRGSRG